MTELPRHLTEAELEQYAHDADSLYEFQRSARVGRGRAKKLLQHYNLKDEVPRIPEPDAIVDAG